MVPLMDKRIAVMLFVLVFLSSMVGTNAPSILVGYGFPIFSIVLAFLLLDRRVALAVTLAAGLSAIPFVRASQSMFMIVAVLGAILRPIFAYVSVLIGERRGSPGVTTLAYGAMDPVVTTSIAILYYGDDGIHVGLSSFDIVPALLAYYVYKASREGLVEGVLAFLSSILFILGFVFFPSWTSLIALLAIILLTPGVMHRLPRSAVLGAASILIIASIPLGGSGLAYNMAVEGYPFMPKSYSQQRWSIDSPLCGSTDNVFSGVYDPARLRIVEDCVVVEGVISDPPVLGADGDIYFDINVTSTTVEPLLSTGSYILRGGKLHAEIVPADRPLLEPYGNTLCQGDRVRIAGPLVVDTDHAMWSEIHPILRITVVERGEGPCITFHYAP